MKNVTLLAAVIASGGAGAIMDSTGFLSEGKPTAAGSDLAELSVHIADEICRLTGENGKVQVTIATIPGSVPVR